MKQKPSHDVDLAQCTDIPFLKSQRISNFTRRDALFISPRLEVALAIYPSVRESNGVVDDVADMLRVRNISGEGVELRGANRAKRGRDIRVKVDGWSWDVGVTRWSL